jgi:hypothetical protein
MKRLFETFEKQKKINYHARRGEQIKKETASNKKKKNCIAGSLKEGCFAKAVFLFWSFFF